MHMVHLRIIGVKHKKSAVSLVYEEKTPNVVRFEKWSCDPSLNICHPSQFCPFGNYAGLNELKSSETDAGCFTALQYFKSFWNPNLLPMGVFSLSGCAARSCDISDELGLKTDCVLNNIPLRKFNAELLVWYVVRCMCASYFRMHIFWAHLSPLVTSIICYWAFPDIGFISVNI